MRTLKREEQQFLSEEALEDMMSSSKKTPAKSHISNLTGVYIYKPLLKLKFLLPTNWNLTLRQTESFT